MFPFTKKNNDEEQTSEQVSIYKSLKKNTEYTNQLFSADINKDFSIRTLTARYNDKKINIFFYSSIVDSTKIHTGIIRPLLEADGNHIQDIITVETMTEINDFDKVVDQINSGKAIIFIDGSDTAYAINVADFQARGVEKPEIEKTIKGPKEAFTESIGANVSLLRKRFHDEHLIAETMLIGKRSRLEVSVMYVNNIVNEDILSNVKDRLKNINVDNIPSIELLEQYIEERPYSIIPTILYTERPDFAVQFLQEGYVILLMDNSSAALIVPVTFWSFLHSPEDRYLRFLFGNFTRIIRLFAFGITLLISAVYVAITSYHSEMIPPDLLLAITSAREKVPLPILAEVVIMEFAFELIREAGIRIPNPLGPTIGIVGALILGQAAVEANIISPIIVIVAAVSGLTSFAIPNTSITYTLRISRFGLIFAAGFFGVFSLTAVFMIWLIYLCSIKSFGVPFFSPYSPYYKSSGDTHFRRILKNEFFRPGQLQPKDVQKRPTSYNKGDSKWRIKQD